MENNQISDETLAIFLDESNLINCDYKFLILFFVERNYIAVYNFKNQKKLSAANYLITSDNPLVRFYAYNAGFT